MTTVAPPAPAVPAPSHRRGISIAVGAVLCFEALWSPVIWAAALIFDSFTEGTYTGFVARFGGWGLLVLFLLLAGAAVVVFARPSRLRVFAAGLCLAAGLLNVAAGVAVVAYNAAGSTGPVGPRLIGLIVGCALIAVGGRLFAEGRWFIRRHGAPPAVSPPPPPV
jgi:hypothetical protein